MSFNASRLVTVWGGFSTKWYAALLDNEQLLHSAKISLPPRRLSAAIATLLGLLAAVALARFGAFRSRMLFFGAVHAPLVLPEVVLGLALLLALRRARLRARLRHARHRPCDLHHVLHHGRAAGGAARLRPDARRSGDGSRRDAGAAFALVALPQIAPALASAFLLAFTLSLDDLVIASFTTGPATTLPMRKTCNLKSRRAQAHCEHCDWHKARPR